MSIPEETGNLRGKQGINLVINVNDKRVNSPRIIDSSNPSSLMALITLVDASRENFDGASKSNSNVTRKMSLV